MGGLRAQLEQTFAGQWVERVDHAATMEKQVADVESRLSQIHQNLTDVMTDTATRQDVTP